MFGYFIGITLCSSCSAPSGERDYSAERNPDKVLRDVEAGESVDRISISENYRSPIQGHYKVTNPTDVEREATNEDGSEAEIGKEDIVSIVFSLPAFRYHEESREDFRKRLREASALPQNRRGSGSYLYCPGDGTFPAREFMWDQKTDILTIRLLGDEVEPAGVHRWKRVSGRWVEQ